MKNKKIIFLGDSITECFDLNKFFKGFNVINKGKSGDTTIDILNRLEESVFMLKPDVLILLIGTNDLELLNSKPEEVIKNIQLIIEKIKAFNEDIIIYLESIYPVDYNIKPFSVGKRTNKDINIINSKIKDIKGIIYLDVNSVLLNDNKVLNNEYTYDGIHLSNKGYEVVSKYLKEYIK